MLHRIVNKVFDILWSIPGLRHVIALVFTPKDIQNKKRVVFLCKGNVCRSPFGEALLRKKLGLSAKVLTASVGWYAANGKSANEAGIRCATGFEVDMLPHVTRNLETLKAEDVDMLVLFEPAHLLKVRPELLSKVTFLSLFEEPRAKSLSIPDPFERGDKAFQEAYVRIEGGVNGLIDKLAIPSDGKQTAVN